LKGATAQESLRATALEGLNRSLAQSASELCWCKILQKSGACGS